MSAVLVNNAKGLRAIQSRNPVKRRGLSLVELMISLAITAMLLTAVAAAYSASASAIEINDRFFRATQAARVCMTQLLTEIRRADSVDVLSSTELELVRIDDLREADEVSRTYSYNPSEKRMRLSFEKLDGTSSPHYTLASNIVSASFHAETRDAIDDWGNPLTIVIRVTVTLVVEVDNSTIRLSGSAVPRRALIY